MNYTLCLIGNVLCIYTHSPPTLADKASAEMDPYLAEHWFAEATNVLRQKYLSASR